MSVQVDRRDDGVVVVTIDRPDALNALDGETLSELRDRLRELATDTGGEGRGPHRRGRPGVRGRRGHQGDDRDDGARGSRLGQPRPRVRAAARVDAEADHRRRQRLRARGRLRARPGVRHPLRVGAREVRPAGDQPRGHPRLGRHPAARARDRRRPGEGPDPDRAHDRRRGGAQDRARERRLSRRGSCSTASSRPLRRWQRRARLRCRRRRTRRTARSRATSAPACRTRRSCSRRSSPAEDQKEGMRAFAEKRDPSFQGR